MFNVEVLQHDATGALLSSPTIHASLDFDLNKSGVEEDDDGYVTAVEAASHTAEGIAYEISKKPHVDSFIKPLLPLPHCDKVQRFRLLPCFRSPQLALCYWC